MNMITDNVNWLAVIVGSALAFGLGMIWFSPRMFGKAWSAGSHNIQPPKSPPMGALLIQAVGTFVMGWAIGVTETTLNLGMAVLVTFAIALLQMSGGMLSQKSNGAAFIDASYVVAMGVIMVMTQGAL